MEEGLDRPDAQPMDDVTSTAVDGNRAPGSHSSEESPHTSLACSDDVKHRSVDLSPSRQNSKSDAVTPAKGQRKGQGKEKGKEKAQERGGDKGKRTPKRKAGATGAVVAPKKRGSRRASATAISSPSTSTSAAASVASVIARVRATLDNWGEALGKRQPWVADARAEYDWPLTPDCGRALTAMVKDYPYIVFILGDCPSGNRARTHQRLYIHADPVPHGGPPPLVPGPANANHGGPWCTPDGEDETRG